MAKTESCFQRYIGIDYSGAQTPTAGLKGLRVYETNPESTATEVRPPVPVARNWTRQSIADWIVERLREDIPTIIGIDHGFSFPLQYFNAHKLPLDWSAFLDDFQKHWPTDHPNNYVDFVRDNNPRSGNSRWRRIVETRSKAKSVFHFDVTGSVAKSTHSGLPWLRYIRNQAGDRVHFWPFDGWKVPAGKSVIAEIYPALWSKIIPRKNRDPHQHDAFCVAETLRDADRDGRLKTFFEPPLSPEELRIASIEGWVLGVITPSPAPDPSTVGCPFCERSKSDLVIDRNDFAVAFADGYPVTKGHTLIVPLRHEANFFNLTKDEHHAMLKLMRSVQRRLNRKHSPDGYNVGVNIGKAGGQTVDHVHLHVIPRYSGDVPDPRGGIRWVVPSKARYWNEE